MKKLIYILILVCAGTVSGYDRDIYPSSNRKYYRPDPGNQLKHKLLSVTHSDTTATTAVKGDIIYALTGGDWRDLPIGDNNDMLGITAGLPSWNSQTFIDHGSLAGLADDDHTQYLRTDGTRDLIGDWVIATNSITLTAGTLTAADGVFTNSLVTIDNAGSGNSELLFKRSGAGQFDVLLRNAGGDFIILGGSDGDTPTKEFIHMHNTGNIGIGDALPLEKLSVNGNISVTGVIIAPGGTFGESLHLFGTSEDELSCKAYYTGFTNPGGGTPFSIRATGTATATATYTIEIIAMDNADVWTGLGTKEGAVFDYNNTPTNNTIIVDGDVTTLIQTNDTFGISNSTSHDQPAGTYTVSGTSFAADVTTITVSGTPFTPDDGQGTITVDDYINYFRWDDGGAPSGNIATVSGFYDLGDGISFALADPDSDGVLVLTDTYSFDATASPLTAFKVDTTNLETTISQTIKLAYDSSVNARITTNSAGNIKSESDATDAQFIFGNSSIAVSFTESVSLIANLEGLFDFASGKIVFQREGVYDDPSHADSSLKFYTATNNVDRLALTLSSNLLATFQGAINCGAGITIGSTVITAGSITDSGGIISFRPIFASDDSLLLSSDGNDLTLATAGGANLTIIADGGGIDFDNENLITTGTLGAGAITGTSLLSSVFGTAAAPSITFSSDLNTGMYHGTGGDQLGFSIGGSPKIFIAVANTQFLNHISLFTKNHNTLNSSLDLQRRRSSSPNKVQNGDILGELKFSGWGSAYQISSKILVTATETFESTTSASKIEFQTTPTTTITPLTRLTINADGFVNIGDGTNETVISATGDITQAGTAVATIGDTVAAALTIGTGAAGVDYIQTWVGENSTGLMTWMEDEDHFQFADEVIFDGNIGIGTSIPQKNLHIESGVPTIRMSDNNAATDQAVATLIDFYRANNTNRVGFVGMESSSNDNLKISTDYAAGQLTLGTGSNVTALTIDSTGNVGIGLTTIDANYKLIVRRAANVNLGIGLQSSELAIAAFNDAISANIPMRFYASEFNLLNGKVGIGVIDPDTKLEIFDTGTQLKLSYDADNHTAFATGSDGNLTITTVDSGGAAGDITLSPDGIVISTVDVRVNGQLEVGNGTTGQPSYFGDGGPNGGNTNYTALSTTGVQTMSGTARVMRSIDLEPILAKRPSANPPAEGTEDSFPTHDFSPTTDESVFFHLELGHDYAAAGTIHVHFDFFVDVADPCATSVVWGVEYKKLSTGDNFDFDLGTTIAYTQTSVTLGTPANDKKIHQSAEINLTTTGFVAGDYILLRLFRDADGTGGTDDFPRDSRVIDYHIEYLSDKIGEAI